MAMSDRLYLWNAGPIGQRFSPVDRAGPEQYTRLAPTPLVDNLERLKASISGTWVQDGQWSGKKDSPGSHLFNDIDP